VYSQQMIVIAYTLFEGILDDFVTSLFGRYPERMYDYINTETNLRGKIDLRELLDAESKNKLIYELARKAASNFVRGSLVDIIKKLQKLTKNSLDEKLIQEMLPVQDLRNQIVHEMSSVDDLPVKPVEASSAINLTNQILLHLEDVAKKLDISIRRLELPEDLK
ncbi:MAG TPA: hypothetical protein VJ022_09980, partial [Anaerolineales bacterium]|nr:hypothetical protein [Anaerolineales bacterium]